jgi:hypothetical protein
LREACSFGDVPQPRQRPETGYRVTFGLPAGGRFDTNAGPERRNGNRQRYQSWPGNPEYPQGHWPKLSNLCTNN